MNAPVEPSALDEMSARLADGVRAYPGTLTYLDLIRKNRRDSTLLLVSMFVLVIGLGVLISVLIGTLTTGGDRALSVEGITSSPALWPSALLGLGAGVVFAVGAALWSNFGGTAAILRMSGAIEIDKPKDPLLFNVTEEMALAAGVPMPRLFVINDSAMNAFATGRDPAHGVVAVTRGLRDNLDREELQGVIAHEIAHIRHHDIRFSLLMATLVGMIVFFADAFLRSVFYGGGRAASAGGRKGGGAAVLVLILIGVVLSIIAPIVARLIQMAYSRQREYLADAGAVELTRNPRGLASALSKLALDKRPLVEAANRGTAHMFVVNPLRKARRSGQRMRSVFCSHPPADERIKRLLALNR